MAQRGYNAFDVKADMYATSTISDGVIYLLICDTVTNDILPSVWRWSASSTAADDFANGVARPTAIAPGSPGRWLWIYSDMTLHRAEIDLATKMDNPSGSASDYIAGNGSHIPFPSIPAAQVQPDWNAVSGMGMIANKPSISNVGTSGNYADLNGKPTIPPAQIQSDWNQSNNSASDFIKNKPTIPSIPSRSFNNAPGASIVTSTGASGFQISSTRDAEVKYSVTIGTTVSLSGNSSGIVVLEICPTNSSTPGDWVEIGRIASGQSGTLVIGLVLNQVGGGQIGGIVPAGYYRRIRSINSNGTPTFTMNSGQEVLL